MPITVSIAEIIDVFEMQNEHSTSYLNKHTGIIETVSDIDSTDEEISPEELEGDEYLLLPTSFDIHEYEIMRDFCRSVEDPELSVRLQNAISGRGAFRYFKDTIHEHGIADKWYAFREQALRQIAIEWCELNGLKYVDEQRGRG